jgi:hypothetical protein
MQKVILFTIFFLFSYAVQAGNSLLFENTVNQVENLNSKVKNIKPDEEDPCENCKSANDFYFQCLFSVCTRGNIDKTYAMIRQEAVDGASSSEIESIKHDIEPMLQKITVEGLKSVLDSLENIKRAQNEIVEDNFQNRTTVNWSLMMNVSDCSDNECKKGPKWARQVAAVIGQSLANDKTYLSYLRQPQIFFQVKYPDMEKNQALQKEIEQEDVYLKAFSESRIFKDNFAVTREVMHMGESDFRKKIRENKPVTEIEVENFLHEIAALHFVTEVVLKNPKALEALESHSIKGSISQLKSPGLQKKVDILIAKIKNTLNSKDEIEPYYSDCIDNYVADVLLAPEEDQIRNFSLQKKEIKHNFKNQMLSRLSETSRKIIEKSFNEWNFALPETKNELKKGVKNRLNAELHDLIFSNKQDNSAQQVRHVDALSAAAAINKFDFDNLESSIYKYALDTLKSSCEEMPRAFPYDAAYTFNGDILVSSVTMKDENVLRPVLYHELGHMLSNSLAEGKKNKQLSSQTSKMYSHAQSCLAAFHRSEKGKGKQYVEEDFADMVSAIVEEGTNKNNVGCFLMASLMVDDAENQNTKGISLLRNTNKQDTHSAPSFRLFHIEKVMRNKLPQSCEKYANKVGDRRQFSDCWPTASH